MKNLKKFEAKAVKKAEAVKGGKQDPLMAEWNEVLDQSIGMLQD